jgi:hypothetical protein
LPRILNSLKFSNYLIQTHSKSIHEFVEVRKNNLIPICNYGVGLIDRYCGCKIMLYIWLFVGYKSLGASHGCDKGNPTEILQGLPTSSSRTGLWVCNPFHHETNPMEL